MEKALARALSIETAATLAGIPRKVLNTWIRFGRAGRPEFVPFVEMIDRANAELDDALMGTIHRKAFEEENLNALMWIYKQRCEKRAQMQQDKELAAEAAVEEAFGDNAVAATEEELEAAERRVMERH